MADVRTLEHATLKVPYELLNKKFRMSQRSIDREITYVTTAANELTDRLINDGRKMRISEAKSAITGVVEKLQNLKRKAEECFDQEDECLRLCKTRISHLEEYASSDGGVTGVSSGDVRAWKEKRIDRMLVDHCLRSGFYDTASLLAKEADIENLVDTEVFMVSRKVEEALRRQETGPCLAWCYENRYKLRKIKSTLEFNVKVQDFVELVRSRRTADALKYAKKYFSSVEENLLGEMQSVMALLAFSDSTQCPPYKRLFDESRWRLLIDQFRQDNFSLHQLNGRSLLSVTLQAGLTALKTRQCYKEQERNPECPVCIAPLNELARPLPFAHFSQSRLICAISGQRMDEHNPPVVLPNGQVYSKTALASAAAHSSENKVTCPKTQEQFHINDAKKLYIM